MNRQKVIILFILIFAFAHANGQDRIITTQEDTLFCKIISLSLKEVKYEQTGYNQEKIIKSIPIKEVREYSLGVQSKEYIPGISTNEPKVKSFSSLATPKHREARFQRWRIGFQGGRSYLLNSLAPLRQAMKDRGVLPDQANNYYKHLRNGISADADLYFLLSRYFGIGLKYSGFSSSHQTDYLVKDMYSDIPIYYSVNEHENFMLNYFGPSFLFQQWFGRNHKFRFNEELSIGTIFFRDKKQFDPNQFVFVNPETNEKQYNVLGEGNVFSGKFQLSLEYYPTSWLSFGLNAGVLPAIFRTVKISDGNTSAKEQYSGKNPLDLSRLDYSFGIRFHL